MHFQAKEPLGAQGRRTLQGMNKHHSDLTDWGLAQISIPLDGAILDLGCGGGRTIKKLATASGAGKVFGLDYSAESVFLARQTNARFAHAGRAVIRQGLVSHLPYHGDRFDLVTAVETHFFWPDLLADLREVLRVLKPGAQFALIAETYEGSRIARSRSVSKHRASSRMTLLTPDEHIAVLRQAGFADVQLFTNPGPEWICVVAGKAQTTTR